MVRQRPASATCDVDQAAVPHSPAYLVGRIGLLEVLELGRCTCMVAWSEARDEQKMLTERIAYDVRRSGEVSLGHDEAGPGDGGGCAGASVATSASPVADCMAIGPDKGSPVAPYLDVMGRRMACWELASGTYAQSSSPRSPLEDPK